MMALEQISCHQMSRLRLKTHLEDHLVTKSVNRRWYRADEMTHNLKHRRQPPCRVKSTCGPRFKRQVIHLRLLLH